MTWYLKDHIHKTSTKTDNMKGKVEGKIFFFLALMIVLFETSCVSHSELISLSEVDEKGQINVSAVPIITRDTLITDSQDTIIRFDTVYAGRAGMPAFRPYRIRPNDQLMIRINAFDGSTEEFINREFAPGDNNNRINFDPPSVHFNSYLVNDSGYIKLPVLERMYVSGLTVQQIKNKVDEAYKPYLRLASSNVKLANRRVTILGEVNTPGVHYLYNERNTLLEAIALAGDFTNFSNRKSVKLIRATEKGPRTVYLNLNRTDFLNTEYFYIQPNDIVYVEPLKPKAFDVSARSIGVVLSAISLGAVLANLFIK